MYGVLRVAKMTRKWHAQQFLQATYATRMNTITVNRDCCVRKYDSVHQTLSKRKGKTEKN